MGSIIRILSQVYSLNTKRVKNGEQQIKVAKREIVDVIDLNQLLPLLLLRLPQSLLLSLLHISKCLKQIF
jgi:hypothetical protein